MGNPPDQKIRRVTSAPPKYLIQLEKELGDAMGQAGMASFSKENSGHLQANGINRGSSGRNIYSLGSNYKRSSLKSILLGQSNSEFGKLNSQNLESIYNQFRDVARVDLTKYKLNLLFELKDVFREIEREKNARATAQVSPTGVGEKRKREELKAPNVQSPNQSANFFDMFGGLFGPVAKQENSPLQNPQPPQAQTPKPNNWLSDVGTWAKDNFKLPDTSPSKRQRVVPPPQEASSPRNTTSTKPLQRAFQPNISLISNFIDKDKPGNLHDLQNYIYACNYLRNNRVNEKELKAELQSQIGIMEKREFEGEILGRFNNVLGFKDGEYDDYKISKQSELTKSQYQEKQQTEAKKQQQEERIKAEELKARKDELIEKRKLQQQIAQEKEARELALNNPDENNRNYLEVLNRNFNNSNIDVNKWDEKGYIESRIIKWNKELKKFGIPTLDESEIVDKNLDEYKNYLDKNIQKLSAQSAAIEEGSKLRNLYSLIAYHQLELSKIRYATDWGKYVKLVQGESNTYDVNKIDRILEDVPHGKYLTGEKHAKTPYYKIQLPPLGNSKSSPPIPDFSESRRASHPRDPGRLENFFTRMCTRVDIATRGTFSTSLSEGMFHTDKELSDARKRGDLRDEDKRWRREVKEDIEGRVEDLRLWSKKIVSRLGERAKPATLSGGSWFDWSVRNGGGGGR